MPGRGLSSSFVTEATAETSSPITLLQVYLEERKGKYDAAWESRTKLSIRHRGAIAVTNYILRLPLDNSKITFDNAKSDGSDVVILDDDDETLLSYWIESWNSVTKVAILWVKIPSLPADSTKIIYLYYNNPAALAVSDYDNTFSKFTYGSNTKANWQMDDASGTTVVDSSGNDYDIVAGTTSPIWNGIDGMSWAGTTNRFVSGDSLLFDGTAAYLVRVDTDALDMDQNDFTLSAWFNASSTPAITSSVIYSKQDVDNGYSLCIDSGYEIYDDFNDNFLDTNKWVSVVGTGSVTEQNQRLEIIGQNAWDTNGVYSVYKFARRVGAQISFIHTGSSGVTLQYHVVAFGANQGLSTVTATSGLTINLCRWHRYLRIWENDIQVATITDIAAAIANRVKVTITFNESGYTVDTIDLDGSATGSYTTSSTTVDLPSYYVQIQQYNNLISTVDEFTWYNNSNGNVDFIFGSTAADKITLKSNVIGLTDSSWHHVAVSLDRDNMGKMYIDGALAGSSDVSSLVATTIANSADITIGAFSDATRHFNGSLDAIIIEMQARSLAESNLLFYRHAKHTPQIPIVTFSQKEDAVVLRLAKYNENVSWNGETWTSFNCQMDTIAENSKGEVERIRISFSNVDQQMANYMASYDLRNRRVTLYHVFGDLLDDVDAYLQDVYYISDVSIAADQHTIAISLASKFDILNEVLPRRTYCRMVCQWIYKSVECGYGGDISDCDKTMHGENGCKKHGNTTRFGGFPGATADRIFVS